MHLLALLAAAVAAAPTPVAVVSSDAHFVAGVRAYVRHVNASGGVDGRPLAVAADGAVVAVTDAGGVVGRGTPVLRFAPSPRLELTALAAHIARTRPAARVAVLHDETGASFVPLLRSLLRAGTPLVAAGTLPELERSRATVLVNLSARAVRFTGRWRPHVYATSAAAGVPQPGTITPVYVRNPAEPRWFRDPGLDPFRPLPSTSYVAGLAAAFTLVRALEDVREGVPVERALRSLRVVDNPFVLPGMILRTGPRDAEVVSQVALQRREGRRWRVITGLISLDR